MNLSLIKPRVIDRRCYNPRTNLRNGVILNCLTKIFFVGRTGPNEYTIKEVCINCHRPIFIVKRMKDDNNEIFLRELGLGETGRNILFDLIYNKKIS